MKKLYYCVSSLHHPHAGVMLDQMMADREKGVEVVMAYCQRALPSCITNIHGNTAICKACGHMHRQMVHRYLKGIRVIALDGELFPESKTDFQYDDIADLKKIKYRKVNIGLSLLSYYVTFTRKPTGKVSAAQREYFDLILSSLCKFVDFVYHLLEKEHPDVVSTFNGRMFENRLFCEISKEMGIGFESVEVCGGHGQPFGRITYEGGLPLDIELITKLANELWEKSPRTEEEKRKIGASFFYNRRNGLPTNDVVYIQAQQKNLLPEGYDAQKQNLVIFNSSEDEISALGGEWDQGNLFETQLEAIRFVVDNMPENTHVYLRIHPNLKNVQAAYHTDLYHLDNSHLTVIPPDSPISSYALMDIADKVFVMGSTMGVESCYWGKPVINLHKSEYFYLDIGYNPQSREELKDMLSKPLQPKSKEGALRYGYYYMATDERVQKDGKVDFNHYTGSLFGFKVPDCTRYLRLFGSSALFQVVYPRFVAHCSRFFKKTTPFPEA